MPSFFSVRLAPGVRLSASSRGLRAHVGPRAARLHVGGGRTGVSTGAGPFTYYTSGGASPRRPGRPSYAVGPTPAQINQAEKAQQARLIAARLDAVHRLHRQDFAPLQRRLAPMPALPPFAAVLATEERTALAGVGLFARTERREARRRARDQAETVARRLLAEARRDQVAEQSRLDATWERLLENDEEVVLPVLEAAFEDNHAPVAAVGTDGGDVAIVVLVPGEDALPDRAPGVTAAGNLSLRPATRTRVAEWYRQLVAGHVLVSVKETLAMAPGAASVTVVAVRRDAEVVSPLLAARFDRERLSSADLATADAWSVVVGVGEQVLARTKGAAGSLQPLDLGAEPELRRLVDAFVAEGW
jgi:hypothetical protein